MYGQWQFGGPWSIDAEGTASEAVAAAAAALEEEENEVVAAGLQERPAPVCAQEWLQGVHLDADGEQCLYSEEAPCSGERLQSVEDAGTGARGCARCACSTAPRLYAGLPSAHRCALPACVQRKLQGVYTKSENDVFRGYHRCEAFSTPI
eukprot:scaffold62378_cov41-Tisochrysis_lutea.AAC.1